jgi:IS5 family transposase
MAIEELEEGPEPVAAGAGGAQSATRAEALAREGVKAELNRTEVIEQLRRCLQRDKAYLARRWRKGFHTSTDDTLASDLHVFALAISYLEERSSARHASHGSHGSHCMLP